MLKPKTVTTYKALLILTLSQKITFKYELNCVAEYFYLEEKFFRLQAKTKKQDSVTFDLPFVDKQDYDLLSKAKLKIVSIN